MSWIAVNKDGSEVISRNPLQRVGMCHNWGSTRKEIPFIDAIEDNRDYVEIKGTEYRWSSWIEVDEYGRDLYGEWGYIDTNLTELQTELPKGTIEKLIGRVMSWEDEPIEI